MVINLICFTIREKFKSMVIKAVKLCFVETKTFRTKIFSKKSKCFLKSSNEMKKVVGPKLLVNTLVNFT